MIIKYDDLTLKNVYSLIQLVFLTKHCFLMKKLKFDLFDFENVK